MKPKQLKTIGLLVVVLIIWGYLIYSVFDSINPVLSNGSLKSQQPAFKKNTEQVSKEKLNLHIPERDPFLNITLVKPRPKIKASQSKPPKTTVDLKAIWSDITYKGIIAKKSTNQYLFLVDFKSNEVILKPQQSYQNYKLINANNESITLKYKSYTKTIPVSKSF